jgi:hypothetical protein
VSAPGPDQPAGDAETTPPGTPTPDGEFPPGNEARAPEAEQPSPLSGAEQLARRLGSAARQAPPPPLPTAPDLEIFFSLLGYHYGVGTLTPEEFSQRWAKVEAAKSLDELYELTADLPFPPPLAHISDRSTTRPSRRRRWFR